MEARTASRAYAERPEGEDCEVVQMTTVKCGATRKKGLAFGAH
jgi:hypothetical protein